MIQLTMSFPLGPYEIKYQEYIIIQMDYQKQKQFLHIKQKLDSLRLPVHFPVETIPLLNSLLSLLDKANSLKPKVEVINSNKQYQSKLQAVTLELQKTTRENNTLHLELIHIKEENQILSRRIQKLEITKDQPNQYQQAYLLRNSRQKQLEKQLTKVINKFNELLDKAYNRQKGFQKIDPEYWIKNMHTETNLSMPNRKYITLSQNKKLAEIHQPSNQPIHAYENVQKSDMLLLQQKLRSREEEILRLQKKMEFDGLNMNKMLKDFHQKQATDRLDIANYQVDLLNKENHQLRQELKKIKANSGRAEVLRKQNIKLKDNLNHQKVVTDKVQRQVDQKEFIINSEKNRLEMDLNQQKKKNQNMEKVIVPLKDKEKAMTKRLEFYDEQLKEAKEKIRDEKNKNLVLEVQIQEIRNTVEGEKLLLSSEIQETKRNLEQALSELRSKGEMIEVLQSKLNKLKSIENLNKEQQRLTHKTMANLQAIVAEQQVVIAQLKGQHNIEQLQVSQKLNEVNYLKRENDELLSRIQKLEQSNKKKKNEHSYQKEIDQLKFLNSNMHKQMQIDQAEIKKLKFEIELLRRSSEQAKESQLSHEKSRLVLHKLENALNITHLKLNSLEEEKQEQQKEYASLQTKYKLLKTEEKKLKAAQQQFEDKLSDRQEIIRRLATEKQQKINKCNQLEEVANELYAEIKTKQTDNARCQQELTKLQKQVVHLHKVIQELQKEHSIVEAIKQEPISQQQVKWLKAQLAKALEKNQKYVLMVRELTEKSVKIKTDNEQLLIDHKNFIKENDHLRSRINELENILHKYQRNQQIIIKNCEELQRRNAELANNNHSYQPRQSMTSEKLKDRIMRIEYEEEMALKHTHDLLN